jgi:hypothetical protein
VVLHRHFSYIRCCQTFAPIDHDAVVFPGGGLMRFWRAMLSAKRFMAGVGG